MAQTEKLITPAYIFDFLKRKRHRILFTAIISFCVLFLICLLALLLLPSDRVFSQKIRIQLNSTNNGGTITYPSGKTFNQLDIISPAVLKQVYTDQNLASVIPFDKFQNLFSVVSYSRKLALLDADFDQKLAKRNLSVVDLNRLEASYNKQLAALDKSTYRINMEPSIHLTNEKSVQILAAIPQTWMTLYRKMEGDKLPQTDFDTNFEKKLRTELQTSRLIALDRATYYNDQLLKLCGTLQPLLENRNISLASGEYLSDLVESLQCIRKYQLDLLRQMILTSSNLRSDLDLYFIKSQIQYLEQELTSRRAQYDSIGKSLSIVQAPSRSAATAKADGGPQQISLDSTVFTQIADLVRSDASNETRRKLADLNVTIGQDIARLQARLQYYQQMLSDLERSKSTAGNVELFNQEFVKMVNNLIATSAKISSFKQLLTKDYLSNLEFYSPTSQVSLLKARLVSPLKLIVFTFGIWVLFNLLLIAIDFARDFYTGRDDNSPQEA